MAGRLVRGIAGRVLLFLLAACAAAAPPSPNRGTALAERLRAALPAWTSLGLSVRDADTGEVLLELDGERALVPASTLKVFTGAAMLHYFGRDHRFETWLAFRGKRAGGRLEGDLVVVGAGDPSLGAEGDERDAGPLLKDWVAAVKGLGIRRITGDVVGDASHFDDRPLSPYALWEDVGNYYGAVTSGLAFLRNEYHLRLRSGERPGDGTLVLGSDPEDTGIDIFENRVLAGPRGSGDQAYLFGGPDCRIRRVEGTIPPGRKGFVLRGSLPDPAQTCAAALRDALLLEGVAVNGQARSDHLVLASSAGGESLDVIHRHLSAPLVELVGRMNRKSDNVYAEQFCKLLGRKVSGEGSWEAGTRVLRRFAQFAGAPVDGVTIKDGSGLSRYNAMTARCLAAMLAWIHGRKALKGFEESLPLAGRDLALTRRFASRALTGRLRAKTGMQERVWSLAGYLRTRSGRNLALALLVNEAPEATAQINRPVEELLASLAGW